MLVFNSRELVGHAAISSIDQQFGRVAAKRFQAACQPLAQMQHLTTAPWQVVQMNCDAIDCSRFMAWK